MYSVLKWCGRKENDFLTCSKKKKKATFVGSLLMTLKMIEIMEYNLDFVHLISVFNRVKQ